MMMVVLELQWKYLLSVVQNEMFRSDKQLISYKMGLHLHTYKDLGMNVSAEVQFLS